MPIVQEPPFAICSAYRPIQWRTFYTAIPDDTIEYCAFTIYVNGTAIATGKKAYSFSVPALIAPAEEFYFDIDIQQYLQRYLAPNRTKTSVFGTLGAETRTANDDCFVTVYVVFQYYTKSAITGKITAIGSPETSTEFYVDITTLQNGDDMDQSTEFYGVPFSTGLKRFLTNSPAQQYICESEDAFLSFISDWNYAQVLTYDSTGTLLGTYYFPTTGGAGQQTTIGVGKEQLSAIPSGTWYSSLPPVWTNVTSYSISCGLGIPIFGGLIYVQNSETRGFIFEECCARSLRVFWLNSLGGVDAKTFTYKELGINVKSDSFEKPLSWDNQTSPYHTQSDFGKARLNIKATRAFACSKVLQNSELAWLKELFYSPEVYIQNPDGSDEYWRVNVSDGNFVEKRFPALSEVSFTLNISQDVITHRL